MPEAGVNYLAVVVAAVIYERRPIALYVLNNAYYVVALAIAGALLAVWG